MKTCACGCGAVVKNKFLRGHSQRGVTFSKESRLKMSRSHTGKIISDETKLKMRLAHLGKSGTPMFGDKNPNWKGGISRKEKSHVVWNNYHPDDIMPQIGYVIHHKDFNHDNNDPNNLQKLTNEEHISLHHKNNIEIGKKIAKSLVGKYPKGQHYLCGRKNSEETKKKRAESVRRYYAKKRGL